MIPREEGAAAGSDVEVGAYLAVAQIKDLYHRLAAEGGVYDLARVKVETGLSHRLVGG